MTNNSTATTDLDYADKLWRAADTLRGQVDAADYKHVVLDLLYLKYNSDSFEACRNELRGELEADGISGGQLERLLESRDEYTAERVFWVQPEARWANLQNQATRPDIATLIDDAILAVERDNPNLKGKLPRDYARRGIAPEKMRGLIDLIAGIGFKDERAGARDMLGRVVRNGLLSLRDATGIASVVAHRADSPGEGRVHVLPEHAPGRRSEAGGEEAAKLAGGGGRAAGGRAGGIRRRRGRPDDGAGPQDRERGGRGHSRDG